MRVEFGGRTVVCVAAMQPMTLDLAALEREVELGRPTTQIMNPQLAIGEYDKLRVIVGPDGRVVAEMAPNIARDTCRRAAAEVIRQATPSALRAVGFNAIARIEAEGDEQPLAGVFDTAATATFLEEEPSRLGAKFVYPSDDAGRLTLEIAPDDDSPRTWLVNWNRHYTVPDDAINERGLSWLAAANEELPSLLRRLPSGVANVS
jgi:hypothetical protein